VSDDVEIQFAYPLGGVRWASPIYVWHIPLASVVSIDVDGRVTFIESVVNSDAIAPICAVLSDEALMAEITSKAIEIDAVRLDSRVVEPDPREEVL
jgi:hypothetical protein